MLNLSKLVVLSVFALVGTAQAKTLQCRPATKALPAIRSVVVQQTAGNLFGGVGHGIAAVQVISQGVARVVRIPVTSYYSKPFAINVFSRGTGGFFVHASRVGFSNGEPDTIEGQVGLGSLTATVHCFLQ
jgi:hypothetical protein